MTKGDKVKVYRGPLAGMTVELRRQDKANRTWHCRLVDYVHPEGATIVGGPVMMFDYELAETLDRKAVNRAKK